MPEITMQRKFVTNNQWTTRGVSVGERFWSKVDRSGPCWEWLAGKTPEGYGLFWLNKTYIGAHRMAYILTAGLIPDGFELDHLCRNPRCVRPSHLEAVTSQENQHRGMGFAGLNIRKTHCPRGHPYDEANTMLIHGHRHCRECSRASTLAWRARQRAKS